MKTLFLVGMFAFCGIAVAAPNGTNADPIYVLETAPQTNRSTAAVEVSAIQSTASVSAVTVSSSVITQIDSTFNAAALAALGYKWQRAEITAQNNGTVDVFCGYSAGGVTVSNSYKITPGAVWTFKIGKSMSIYCLNTAASSGTLIVGGIAWIE